MILRALMIWLTLMAGMVSVAAADYWKHPNPGAPWVPIWGGNYAAAIEQYLQGACATAKPTPNPAAPDDGGRYLSVRVTDFAYIEAHCFYHPVLETVVHKPDLSAGPPQLPPDFFNPYDRTLPRQIMNPSGPYVRPEGKYQGPIELRSHPNFCIEVQNARLEDGAPLTVFPCTNGPSQQLLYSTGLRGQMVVMPGSKNSKGYDMCADYYPAQGNPGDVIRIWPCHQLTSGVRDSQIWLPLGQPLRADATSKRLCMTSNSTTGQGYLILQACQEDPGKDTPFDWQPHKPRYKLLSGADDAR